MNPITIDLSGLGQQFNLGEDVIDSLTETSVNAVTASIYSNWEAIAKKNLHSTLPEYLTNLTQVDKGRFSKQIMLTGKLPNMIEQGASPFDIKEGFKKSDKVKYTLPKLNKKGTQISPGGSWFLTIPFRIGSPGSLGQAGFSKQMPSEVYSIMKKRAAGVGLTAPEIPSPYEVPQSREAIMNEKGGTLFAQYEHKNSIYEGVSRREATYDAVKQNTYGSFRRAGENSDPMSWIHKGFKAGMFSEQAVKETDVDTIVENEVTDFLETIL